MWRRCNIVDRLPTSYDKWSNLGFLMYLGNKQIAAAHVLSEKPVNQLCMSDKESRNTHRGKKSLLHLIFYAMKFSVVIKEVLKCPHYPQLTHALYYCMAHRGRGVGRAAPQPSLSTRLTVNPRMKCNNVTWFHAIHLRKTANCYHIWVCSCFLWPHDFRLQHLLPH